MVSERHLWRQRVQESVVEFHTVYQQAFGHFSLALLHARVPCDMSSVLRMNEANVVSTGTDNPIYEREYAYEVRQLGAVLLCQHDRHMPQGRPEKKTPRFRGGVVVMISLGNEPSHRLWACAA